MPEPGGFFRGTEPGYHADDRERWYAEPPKDPRRGEFARDRARVVHSSGLRRLSAKTQVVGPETDFVRNRLTHSLEVAQVGRELGAALGCDPDVVDTACLSHDLGHPPFGHNGEDVLNEIADGIGGFEGNAQTLRMLTRLEPKVVDGEGRPRGLNLTRASLDAATKYPWRRGLHPRDPSSGKFGVYDDDLAVFSWLREGAGVGVRCVEAQVMDLADDIAYSVHDVEDAIVGGRVDPVLLGDRTEKERVVAQTRDWYLPAVEHAEIEEALRRLTALPAWVHDFDGSYRALAALKDMTSQLIGRFVRSAQEATRRRYGPGVLTRYAADVVVPRETRCEIAVLKGIAALYVMALDERKPIYAHQQEVLAELVSALLAGAPAGLDPWFAAAWLEADARGDAAGRLRTVVDQVASLTDARALTLHAALR
ncbi:deoxyguanosinetriphosphate triphosphohydrolase [Spongisporangium articulatum]|uniref:Deoxyguanosinetriphosphate triphosphohydrolase n=1 Tax=Spongisporangium articulatum TaxID=3362603 RepID=A0ABW8ALD2_9ACTN